MSDQFMAYLFIFEERPYTGADTTDRSPGIALSRGSSPKRSSDMATADIFLKTDTLTGIAGLFRRWTGQTQPSPAREVEDTRARRDFILEMMETCPDAFTSEDAARGAGLYISGRF
jgi:hypothetical protein